MCIICIAQASVCCSFSYPCNFSDIFSFLISLPLIMHLTMSLLPFILYGDFLLFFSSCLLAAYFVSLLCLNWKTSYGQNIIYTAVAIINFTQEQGHHSGNTCVKTWPNYPSQHKYLRLSTFINLEMTIMLVPKNITVVLRGPSWEQSTMDKDSESSCPIECTIYLNRQERQIVGKGTEAQRNEVTCPRSHTNSVA